MNLPLDSGNVYQNQTGPLDAEADRLRNFDVPTQASIEAIGPIQAGTKVLDIGSGENLGFGGYVRAQGADYISLDIRHGSLIEQSIAGGHAVEGDARALPFPENSVDTAHARFVLAHFGHEDRGKIVAETLNSLKPSGQAVLIDYDWTAIDGSEAMLRLRDFTLENVKIFDGKFGADSVGELGHNVAGQAGVYEVRTSSPHLVDYAPVLGLRQVTLRSLVMSGAGPDLIDQATSIFDRLVEEAESEHPPGFRMPDMVAVVVTKPEVPLFPELADDKKQVAAGEYKLINGDSQDTNFDPDRLNLLDESELEGPMPGVFYRGTYREQDEQGAEVELPVVSFLYHKYDAACRLEIEERMIIWRGIGYGEHSGHAREAKGLSVEPTAKVKHFSIACVTNGPLGRAIPANPR